MTTPQLGSQRRRQLGDLTDGPPVARRDAYPPAAAKFLRQLGAANAIGRVQIEDIADQGKAFGGRFQCFQR